MRTKLLLWIVSIVFLEGCAQSETRTPGYRFDNFRGTPAEMLANAVRNDAADDVTDILKHNPKLANYQDPYFKQTLLALSIVNKRKASFEAMLNNGADPNIIMGFDQKTTPLLVAITYAEGCDTYFVKKLLDHGADPNLSVPAPNWMSGDYGVPILDAIGQRSHGEECTAIPRLLTEHGADIEICVRGNSSICEGVITKCVHRRALHTLEYFVVERHIRIPDTVYSRGGYDPKTERFYSLKEKLELDDTEYLNHPEDLVAAKKRVLHYLEEMKK